MILIDKQDTQAHPNATKTARTVVLGTVDRVHSLVCSAIITAVVDETLNENTFGPRITSPETHSYTKQRTLF